MSLARDDPRHGTANGYMNLGCRCDRCRRANTEHHWRNGTAGYARDTCPGCGGTKRTVAKLCRGCHLHRTQALCGTETAYANGCRCDLCRAANAAGRRARRAKERPS